jgi:hypothetical protein
LSQRVPRPRNYEQVADLVAEKVESTARTVGAQRLLPAARAARYAGSDRNLRRAAEAGVASGGRPRGWSSAGDLSPGEVLTIDWGPRSSAAVGARVLDCLVAVSVRPFATDERQATTLGLFAECFEVLGASRR